VPATPQFREIGPACFEIAPGFRPGMRVPVRVFATRPLLDAMDAQVFVQAANVAALPGIQGASLCMPDAHWGYGFPIGGVAAVDPRGGVISPGGIGFDIGCGVRLVRSDLGWDEVAPRLRALVDALADRVPAGVGAKGAIALSEDELRDVMVEGARWCLRRGLATVDDLARTESGGCVPGADPACVSDRAVARGLGQLGTLGSGNHYLEIQRIPPGGVFDATAAAALGLSREGQVVVMLHCGSRGFGHQVASDHLETFLRGMKARGETVVDRELACAPFDSAEGRVYFAAMACAANLSFANRQVILHAVREVFADVFGRDPEALGLRQVYDVAHNVATLETHECDGSPRTLLVHRKGATRALPPAHPDLPPALASLGQPVILGGSMETGSMLLLGAPGAARSFHSSAHGSGRTLSRTQARKRVTGDALRARMAEHGIYVRATTLSGLAEEAGFAYKSLDEVTEATELAGLSRRVVRFWPVGNVKG
jgi:tRNA-splicing ligase RtcB